MLTVFFYTGTEITESAEVTHQTDGARCSFSQLEKFKAHICCLEQTLQRYQLKLSQVMTQERMYQKTVQNLHKL